MSGGKGSKILNKSVLNKVMEGEKITNEWRKCVLAPIFKNKGDIQSCNNCRGIELISHNMSNQW